MWKLYDELIEAIPSGIKISDMAQTERWTFVVNDQTIGTAMKFSRTQKNIEDYQNIQLQEAAEFIKSWDFEKASFGLAAINSFFNDSEQVQRQFQTEAIYHNDAFDQLMDTSDQQKIGMIGHFPFVDRYPELSKNISIFELEPRAGDYPASACEFLLPQQEIVYITASTIINKTLPRLLELSAEAQVILVGSSCPLSQTLFRHGIDTLAGTIYEDSLAELRTKKSVGKLPLSKYGHSIMIEKRKD
ncbi:DUF364 domain-containing protein [Enterococcus wangshanyuanii]|uniref:Heavy-metal chelation domain-containing protein n=1 Tax=Enterococcus wangshanyuanii TaxID=2005703 RepID=A0ABQ1NMF9_9ENTE|nr:DUF364 domain-containing protein [Enterococcus wangshanyuanii]GGC78800.1 hypothetical protein GCM10011573_05640 [Enterococcus wangshanyuanii]